MDNADKGYKNLYDRLNDVYRQVQEDFDIVRKSKKFEKAEKIMGLAVLIFLTGAVVEFINNPTDWYWMVLAPLLLLSWLGSLSQNWDLDYIDVFLERLEEEKQKNPSLFVYTLRQWVRNLPQKDRAKTHLVSITGEMSAVNVPPKVKPKEKLPPAALTTIPIPEPAPEPTPPPAAVQEAAAPPLPSPDTTEIIASAEETTASAADREREKDEYEYEAEYKDEDKDEGEESCPKCGSDWIRAVEKRPGKIIYNCENCGKKWKPRRR